MTVIVRRIASSLVMLFAVSALSFAVLELAPGDFFAEMQADARVGSATWRLRRSCTTSGRLERRITFSRNQAS